MGQEQLQNQREIFQNLISKLADAGPEAFWKELHRLMGNLTASTLSHVTSSTGRKLTSPEDIENELSNLLHTKFNIGQEENDLFDEANEEEGNDFLEQNWRRTSLNEQAEPLPFPPMSFISRLCLLPVHQEGYGGGIRFHLGDI